MYSVDVSSEQGYNFKVKSKGYEFLIDIDGNGITPPDVLLASLASCVGVYIRKYADGANLGIKTIKVGVEGDLGKAAPYYFRKISVKVRLDGIDLDERRKSALLAFLKNCPVHNTLKMTPEIAIDLER